MILQLDQGDIEVPKIIETRFREAKEKGLKDKKEKDFWNQSDDVCFHDWYSDLDHEIRINEGQLMNKQLMSKELAEFVVDMELGTIPHGGGYPKQEWFEFETNGYKYTVIAFGWANDEVEDGCDIRMVGYREKI